MPNTRVEITNNLPAPQGFYGVVDPNTLAEGGEAVVIRKGETKPVTLDETQLRYAHLLGSGVTIRILGPAEDAAQPAPASADAAPAEALADDGVAAHSDPGAGSSALAPPAGHDNTAGGAPPEQPTPDQFESMDEDGLRAFITDRDGAAPHHRTGRPKLLDMARGLPVAEDGAEGV